MKIQNLLLFTTLLLFFTSFLKAQQDGIVRCYSTEYEAELRDRFPERGTTEDFENWIAPLVRAYKASPQSRAVQTIPIIFHVIHNNDAVGSGDNISATYIQAQLDQLNNDYRKLLGTSGYNNDPVGADTELEFCMALVDPQGNTLAEPGIDRINSSSMGWSAPPYGTCTNGFNDTYIENTIKPQSQWNPDDYLNVWVMDINCGILGYAQFPSQSGLGGLNSNEGSASTDGVVLLTTSLGSTATPNPAGGSYNKGRTATHEIGHFFGLRHIWGDGGCSVDDYCTDTPSSDAANYGCPTGHSSCNSIDMVENYMDYTDDDCMNIFTADQKARIQTVMANSPRRGSLANSTACSGGGGGGGSTCSTSVSSFPYSEGFESGQGDWTNESSDDFDWSRRSGSTPSSNTGPSSAAGGSYYMYVESSSPNYPSKTTLFTSPCFDLTSASQANFSFEYHMYGASSMGNLSLLARTEGGSWTTVWSASGNQGNSWQSATVDLGAYIGSVVELQYSGVTGSTWQGDMAIDDISLTTTSGGGGGGGSDCTGGISSLPYSEGWESDFGVWTQDNTDDFDWTRRSGSTPSSNTGPSSATEGSTYAYCESSSPNYSNKTAILNSPCIDLTTATQASFDFAYHMYGAAAMGSLTLEARVLNGTWSSAWSKSGNQGNSWQTASVDLSAYAGESIELRFVGLTGTTWQGDMAIDDLSISTSGSGGGGGGGSCTTVNISITFDNYPEETSWDIRDSGGNVVASGGTYASQADGSTLNLQECLNSGCYDFTIYDAYGDGICCSYGSGSYTVSVGGTTVATGGAFTSSETTNFCVGSGTRMEAQEVAVDIMSVFPNPAKDVVTIELDSKANTDATIFLINTLGEQVQMLDWKLSSGANSRLVDVSQIVAGTYLIQVATSDNKLTKRIVIVE